MKEEIKGVRANRPSAALVEDLKVEYYGNLTPLKHMASISVKPPREINIQVWDKEAVNAVAKAIELSDLGLSANTEDNVIRVFLPELSEERRKELVRHVKKILETFRIKVRQAREEANQKVDDLFDKKEISEDDKFKIKEQVQEETEWANEEIEKIFEAKEKEIQS